MNQGYTGVEIANQIKLPSSLAQIWSNRDYYGTLSHNAKAVYQRYVGWYDGHPSSLNELSPVDTAKKYVQYMGGEQAILEKTQADFSRREYRCLAMVLKTSRICKSKYLSGKKLIGRLV